MPASIGTKATSSNVFSSKSSWFSFEMTFNTWLLPPTGITNLALLFKTDKRSSGYDLGAAAHNIPSYAISWSQSVYPSPYLILTLWILHSAKFSRDFWTKAFILSIASTWLQKKDRTADW